MKLPRRKFLHLTAGADQIEKWAKVIRAANIKAE